MFFFCCVFVAMEARAVWCGLGSRTRDRGKEEQRQIMIAVEGQIKGETITPPIPVSFPPLFVALSRSNDLQNDKTEMTGKATLRFPFKRQTNKRFALCYFIASSFAAFQNYRVPALPNHLQYFQFSEEYISVALRVVSAHFCFVQDHLNRFVK